jgi:flagellar biosynthesis/type III secretory pathway protein FliH
MRKDCVGCDSLEEDNTRLTAELEAANKKLEAYERMKADGIPQGVLDGYDAGFLAGKAKLAEVQKQALEQYGCSCVQCMNLVYTPEDE